MNRRRRSVLLASAFTLAASTAACEKAPPTAAAPTETMQAYTSVEQCEKAWDRSECIASFQKAGEEHDRTAPKFATQAECEAEFECEERRTSTGSFFMPLMAGYMMGRMMSGAPIMGQPAYVDRKGAVYSGNARVAPSGGLSGGMARTVQAPMTADGRVAATGANTTRGGFGQTSSYRGSAGG